MSLDDKLDSGAEANDQPENKIAPDWKQWLPFYGWIRSKNDREESQPSMEDPSQKYRRLFQLYHLAVFAGVAFGTIEAIEYLVKIAYK